jgi:LDH2 family malate/lactate/ureidoglycolate dehydrogenase
MKVEPARLRAFISRLLESLGVPAEDAETVAACLVEADLEGQASHGAVRLPLYARRVRAGLIAAVPEMRAERAGDPGPLLDELRDIAGEREVATLA